MKWRGGVGKKEGRTTARHQIKLIPERGRGGNTSDPWKNRGVMALKCRQRGGGGDRRKNERKVQTSSNHNTWRRGILNGVERGRMRGKTFPEVGEICTKGAVRDRNVDVIPRH